VLLLLLLLLGHAGMTCCCLSLPAVFRRQQARDPLGWA
jgi:hypothetical protein